MAELDPAAPSVVITIVYDGPPRAGKTTSVRALARSFGREVYTPEERDGRTVYFDWLEHVGGRFDGLPIHCQIASVPGQRHWRRRRAHFLDRADVVVFVGDTTIEGWPETASRLVELRTALDDRDGAPVGLVFQANKRDRADVVSMEEIRAHARDTRTAVVESIAEDGSGVREAFVFAVRLALDRVREGRVETQGRSGFGTARGNDLVELLRALDVSTAGSVAPAEPPTALSRPRPPSQDAPSGFVWPPVEGRIMLREAAMSAGLVEQDAQGDYAIGGAGWHMHSAAEAVFDDVERARAVLVQWARRHAAAKDVLSRHRCIVLAETGDGGWRLWQIVRAEPTLRMLGLRETDRLLERLAAERARMDLPVECTPDTVGVSELNQPVFVGLLPVPGEAR